MIMTSIQVKCVKAPPKNDLRIALCAKNITLSRFHIKKKLMSFKVHSFNSFI